MRRVAAVCGAVAVLALSTACSGSEPEAAVPLESAASDPPFEPPAEPTSDGAAPGTDAAGPATVDVVITYAGFQDSSGAVEVGGFATGVIEEGGLCVLTLSRAGQADVTAQSAATPDARNTACGLLAVPGDQLSPGEWTARVDYRSARSAGSSTPQTLDVP